MIEINPSCVAPEPNNSSKIRLNSSSLFATLLIFSEKISLDRLGSLK